MAVPGWSNPSPARITRAMDVISLTSIPSRFAGLGPVLESLLSQGADRVALALPRRYARFAGPVTPPPLPSGVTLLRPGADHGPITKLLPAQARWPDARLILCDDDCLYGAGWLDALCAAYRPGVAVAASTFPVSRLKRRGGLVAQGFAGVLLPPGITVPPPPEAVRAADDLWISAHLAQAGFGIVPSTGARAHVTPHAAPAALQDADRAGVYALAAAHVHRTTGLWPPL